ncbi:MAG: hypothetical protein ACKO2G_11420 [Verrucomicrobiales bacterium]
MALLTILTIGLLSLSRMSLRRASLDKTQAEAQANARLAMTIAIANLQREMGPDMRVSVEAALFDQNTATPETDGVAQPHWMASYDSWGDWLNASYQRTTGSPALTIGQTYTPRRSQMFRRWMLSVPSALERNDSAPLALNGWNDTNSKIMIGQGSLGQEAQTRPEKVTRAYLNPMGANGLHAWWIGPENHKARIDKSKKPRNLANHVWQVAHSDTAEVGVGKLPGFEAIDGDASMSDRLVTSQTLGLAGVSASDLNARFFDVTASSQGVLSSARTGALKRDLSLLFEQPNNSLPAPYRFDTAGAVVEPSIRPMSPEIVSRATLRNRHFQSWTNMRHYYNMYRSSSDATIGGTNGSGTLNWDSSKPWTNVVCTTNLTSAGVPGGGKDWNGSNNYWRVPILAKITFIYSLLAEPDPTKPGRFRCYHVFSPVFTYWNPYNTEMRIPDRTHTMATSAYRVWPHTGEVYVNGVLRNAQDSNWAGFGTFAYSQSINAMSVLRSENGGDIIFKPGEFRVFSYRSNVTTGGQATSGSEAPLYPGFDPRGISGEKKDYKDFSPRGAADGTFSPTDRLGVRVLFSHGLWGGNINRGNTGGSLCWQDWWDRPNNPGGMPMTYANDWFNKAQTLTPMTPTGTANISQWVFDGSPQPVAFCQLVLKGLSEFNYESIGRSNPAPNNWAKDWRSRNWIQAPPFYFGNGMYCSEDETTAHTQRLDNPYVTFFGPMTMSEMPKVVGQIGQNSFFGSGSNPFEKVTSVPALELPSAPPGSLAAFSTMRINPGWTKADQIGIDQSGTQLFFHTGFGGSGWTSAGRESLHAAETKRVAYQSGITGPGIGNSFLHPMIPRTDIYRFFDNSKSQDVPDRQVNAWMNTIENNSKAYVDFWDHVLLLNDALWDDFFVSSLADQTRPGATGAVNLRQNIERMIRGEQNANSRYRYYSQGRGDSQVLSDLTAADGYLKAARHMVVDGMFNVNSTSVAAWYSLFAGIRERQLVYRDSRGTLQKIDVPSNRRIGLSRFGTEVSDKEMNDPEYGVAMPDGSPGWSGVRFLSDAQLLKLAQECVKQVKQRGPFLNFSEFINRRLSNDELGLKGAVQAAIDYDDARPENDSINYRYKFGPDYMLNRSSLGTNSFATPEAAEGSRFAGIPGYVIQSDLLKPIANTLSVRDDTFRIRTYGEVRDRSGRTVGRAWCEAIVQRVPDYVDSTNDPSVPARLMSANGVFSNNPQLTVANRQFGRKFRIESFRWLNGDEI